MSNQRHTTRNAFDHAPRQTRRLKCPYCHHVFDHTDLLAKERKVVCKGCLKVFNTDQRHPHSA